MIWTSMVPYIGLQARILNILQKFNSLKFLVNYVKGMLLKLKMDFRYNSNWQNISRHIQETGTQSKLYILPGEAFSDEWL